MVKMKVEDNKSIDFEDQIRKFISSAAAHINIKDDVFDTEDHFLEDEPSMSSDKETDCMMPDIKIEKSEPQIYPSTEQMRHLSDAPGNAVYYPDYLSMYCDDNTPLVTVKEEDKNDSRLHEGFQCDICNGDIIGFRYTCVQCNNYDLCVSCESGGEHPHHFMLRIPSPRPFKSVEALLTRIRSCLETEADALSPPVINNLYNVRLSDICKGLEKQEDQKDPANSKPVIEDLSVSDLSVPEDTADEPAVPDNNTAKVKTKEKRKKSFKPPHIKKPLNAFMLFLKDMRGKVVPDKNVKYMSAVNKQIGKQWHALSREEQLIYYIKAAEERRIHRLLYPDWSVTVNKRKKRRHHNINNSNRNKKCRGTHGLEYKNMWCDGCKRKKKCQRYMADEAVGDSQSLVDLDKNNLENPSNETVDHVTVLNSFSEDAINVYDVSLKVETSSPSSSPDTSRT